MLKKNELSELRRQSEKCNITDTARHSAVTLSNQSKQGFDLGVGTLEGRYLELQGKITIGSDPKLDALLFCNFRNSGTASCEIAETYKLC